MKSKTLGLVVAALLAGPLSAFATPITWTFAGVVTEAHNSDVAGGDPFQLVLTFDSAAALVQTTVLTPPLSGTNYQYSGASIGLLASGPSLPCFPCQLDGYDPAHPAGGIGLVDNLYNSNTPGIAPSDRLAFTTFQIIDAANATRHSIILSGASNLLSGAGIPSTPDPQFSIQFVSCNVRANNGILTPYMYPNQGPCSYNNPNPDLANPEASFVTANLTLVSVPEPATVALLGIGLAGLGFTRRRRLS